MQVYTAFLRGINVGSSRLIKMVDLKACFENMGFTDVTTILQSGNVIFKSNSSNVPALKDVIESGLSTTFNYPAKVQIFTIENLKEIINKYPFDSAKSEFQHYVIFFEGNRAVELAAEADQLDPQLESMQAGDGVVYWTVEKGMTLKSPFSKYLTRAKYKEFNTNRNINTLLKIVAKAEG